jgi:hypothetical protein
LWIDIFAVLYLVIAMILIAVYIAIRYPGSGSHQIPSDDPVMWAWALTSLVGPPLIHVVLAILTMMGKNPRVPLVWKIAATVAARQEERLASDGQPPQMQFPKGHKLPMAERPAVEEDREADAREHRPSIHASMQTDENDHGHTGPSTIQSLQQVSASRGPAREVVRPINHEARWDPLCAERGNKEGSYATFSSYKWLYGILTALVLILGLLLLVIMFESTSLSARIVSGICAAFLIFLAIGFGGMAKSPIRLEIGSCGVQLFARSGTTWLPWEVIEKIDIKKVGGIPHLVAWLRYSDIFPVFDTFGGGPRFLPEINAIAVCSLSILHTPRHQVARALRIYGGSSTEELPGL